MKDLENKQPELNSQPAVVAANAATLADKSAFAVDRGNYKTPMQKFFGPFQHIGIDYFVNSGASIGVTWIGQYGPAKPAYDKLKNTFVNTLRMGDTVGTYLTEIFTLCLVGHILAPAIIWMENHKAGIVEWMDGIRDAVVRHKPDEAETALRQAAYVKMDAEPKIHWWGAVTNRILGLLSNMVFQGTAAKLFNLKDKWKGLGEGAAGALNLDKDNGMGKFTAQIVSITFAEALSCMFTALSSYVSMKTIIPRIQKYIDRNKKPEAETHATAPRDEKVQHAEETQAEEKRAYQGFRASGRTQPRQHDSHVGAITASQAAVAGFQKA